ncbi:DMT family transporter [Cellulomonas soli]|uniref:Membrane protein n=1 Tax=Cellulomonas soli TaxID=931535 RepID=A0A512PCI2_9CELL|nr:DMT family transporter [Cellulomonas soli]NYI58410.1 DME family drug/metabolite transporter [Cellulomonas soli]GEP68832.1 membrane protein [Cellulomonas soli]
MQNSSVVRTVPGTSRSRGFTLVALAGVVWGTGGLAGALVARTTDLSWPAIASLRLLGGGLVMLAVAAATGALRTLPWNRAVAARVAATGVLAGIYQGAYFVAVDLAGVALSTVVALGSAPVVVAVVTACATRRMPPRATLLALVCALVGLALLTGTPTGGDGRAAALGAGLALVSGASFAATTLLNRTLVRGLPPAALIGSSFTLAGLLLVPPALVAGFALAGTGAAAGGWLVYLAALPTACAYLAYYSGLPLVPATTAAVLALLEPVTATVLSVLVLDERVSLAGLVGMALLLAAVVLLRPAHQTAGANPGAGALSSDDSGRVAPTPP